MPATLCEPSAGEGAAVGRACRAISDLPEEERGVFLLRQNGGLSYEEIASGSGRTPAAVKALMRSALHRLAEALH